MSKTVYRNKESGFHLPSREGVIIEHGDATYTTYGGDIGEEKRGDSVYVHTNTGRIIYVSSMANGMVSIVDVTDSYERTEVESVCFHGITEVTAKAIAEAFAGEDAGYVVNVNDVRIDSTGNLAIPVYYRGKRAYVLLISDRGQLFTYGTPDGSRDYLAAYRIILPSWKQ